MRKTAIKRGDVFWVDFDPSKGTEIKKTRPALICSHDILNDNSSRIIVAPITSKLHKIYSFEYKISDDFINGKIMLDQIRSIDKSRLGKKITSILHKQIFEIEEILRFLLGI